MKSILLKLDDKLFEELEASAKDEKTPKTTYIKRAIEAYTKAARRRKLEDQLKFESMLVREESMLINKEISESFNTDFLNDDY